MTRATLINSITKQNKIKLEQASWPAPASKFYYILKLFFLSANINGIIPRFNCYSFTYEKYSK